MSIPMLVVDNNLEVSRREQTEWDRRGISTVRVDTMCEAINELSFGEFLFVAINADSVNYLPALKVMCDMSTIPVFIITSNFSVYAQIEALHNGADAYVPFQDRVDENIMLALALINKYNDRRKHPPPKHRHISYEKMLVFPLSRQAFCDNEEIPLTKTEFDILTYFLANRGIVLSYNQIYCRVWGREYQDSAHSALWNHVLKLRKKIARATGNGYIENVKDVGYRLPTYNK